jgi:hypothetical protein
VYRNIVELMKQVHAELSDSADDQCLEAFDQVIRNDFQEPFMRRMGRFLFTYEQLMICCMFMWVPKWVDFLGGIGHGLSLANSLPLVVWYIMTVGFVTPLHIALLGLIAGTRVRVHGLAEFVLLSLMLFGQIILMIIIMVISDRLLYGWATRSLSGPVTFFVVAISSSVSLSIVLTSPSCMRKCLPQLRMRTP